MAILVALVTVSAIAALVYLLIRGANQYVYVNQDGSVRELSSDEQQYLSQSFDGFDSGRPYIKTSYETKNGWGSVSGFLLRNRVPRHLRINRVNPEYVPPPFDFKRQALEDGRRLGDIVTENAGGSVTCTPNPNISRKERFELLRQLQLERQREREKLARHPGHTKQA